LLEIIFDISRARARARACVCMCAEVGSRGRAQLHHLKLNVIRLLESGHPQATGSSLPERRTKFILKLG